MEASHVGGFDDFDEFCKILSNCQMNENKLNTWRPAMLADLTTEAKYRQICHFHHWHILRYM